MVIGIEIGGTKLQLVVGDETGTIHKRTRLAVDAQRGACGIRDQLKESLPKLMSISEVTTIGVGFGGPVDWKSGRICRSHQVEGWSEFDLAGWLHELSNLPVRVDNDANVGSLGEGLRGAGRGLNPAFYVTLGSGVGGGLVLDGKIYHGATPGEAEIGHIRLDRKGTIVESRCSGWAVDARIRSLTTTQPASVLCTAADFGKGAEAKHLPRALNQGDAAAQSILRELAEDLAFGLSHVVHLFHPEVIVLGGGLSGIGESLRSAVARALTGFVMEAFRPGPQIALASLGEDAVPVGALLLGGG